MQSGSFHSAAIMKSMTEDIRPGVRTLGDGSKTSARTVRRESPFVETHAHGLRAWGNDIPSAEFLPFNVVESLVYCSAIVLAS